MADAHRQTRQLAGQSARGGEGREEIWRHRLSHHRLGRWRSSPASGGKLANVSAGASLAWNANGFDESKLVSVLSRDVFGDSTGKLAGAAFNLGFVHKKLGVKAPNETPLGTVIAAPKPEERELFCRDGLNWFARIPAKNIRAALKEIEKQRAKMSWGWCQAVPPNTQILGLELNLAARMAVQSCKFMLWQQAMAAGKISVAKGLAQTGIRELKQLEKDFNALGRCATRPRQNIVPRFCDGGWTITGACSIPGTPHVDVWTNRRRNWNFWRQRWCLRLGGRSRPVFFGISRGLCGDLRHFFSRLRQSQSRFGSGLLRFLIWPVFGFRCHVADFGFGKFHFANVKLTKLVRRLPDEGLSARSVTGCRFQCLITVHNPVQFAGLRCPPAGRGREFSGR